MAIWQFSVSFIPRENLLNRFGEIPTAIDDEILWKEDLDEGVLLPSNYENYLSKLGEKEKLKWTPNSLNWGDYDDGTHIMIDLQKKDSIDVFARFDVGELDMNFVQVVLDFAKMCKCVLLTKNETIIEPQVSLFLEEMKKSNSYKFCKDPIGYLQSDEVKQLNRELKKKLDKDEFDFNS